jgi:hypothetical protein
VRKSVTKRDEQRSVSNKTERITVAFIVNIIIRDRTGHSVYLTRLQARRPRNRSSIPEAEAKDFSLLQITQPESGVIQSPAQLVPSALSQRVKRSRCEASHSPPFSDELKCVCVWNYISTSPRAFTRCSVTLPTFYTSLSLCIKINTELN